MTIPDRGPLDALTDVRFELLALNDQIRELLSAVHRLQPVVNVEPAPVVVQGGEPVALDLSPLLAALERLDVREDKGEVEELKGLRKDIETLGVAMRAIAGSMGGTTGIGASVVTAAGDFPVMNSNSHPLHVTVDNASGSASDSRGLTERMFAKAPASGHTLYLDTADATYIYIAEAPVGGTANAQGIRVTKDASGNPLGAVATASGFDWNSRASATWSS